MVPALLSVFYMCCDASIVVTVLNSCHFAFCFTSFFVMLVVIKSCIGIQGEVSWLKKCFKPLPHPPVVYYTDRSKAVVQALVLLFDAMWFILRGDLF